MALDAFIQPHKMVKRNEPNGIPPPGIPLPLPDGPDTITANLLLIIGQTQNPRHKFIFQHLVKHLHAFFKETNLSTDEWTAAVEFLAHIGQGGTPQIALLSKVFGVFALIDSLNNPVTGGATESSYLGPYYTIDAEDVEHGGSIASEGKGEYMYVEGRVLTTEGKPISGAIIDSWEADDKGFYDTQYVDRVKPDCRGRMRTAEDGSFGFRAIVPHPYAISPDGPVGQLLLSQGRHNFRPSHLHMMVQASGYHKLVTSLYPEQCHYVTSDPLFGVKKSLVVKLEEVNDDAEARTRGFPKGGSFKLLKHDLVLLTEEQSHLVQEKVAKERQASYLQSKND